MFLLLRWKPCIAYFSYLSIGLKEYILVVFDIILNYAYMGESILQVLISPYSNYSAERNVY